MSRIELAKNSGFCFGVKQAMEKTEEQISRKIRENTDGIIYTFGHC